MIKCKFTVPLATVIIPEFKKIEDKLSDPVIHSKLQEFADLAAGDVRDFLLNREYLNHGKTYQPLAGNYLSSKNQQYKHHFFINTGSFLNTLHGKTDGNNIEVHTSPERAQEYQRNAKIRPVIHDHAMIIAEKTKKRIENWLRSI